MSEEFACAQCSRWIYDAHVLALDNANETQRTDRRNLSCARYKLPRSGERARPHCAEAMRSRARSKRGHRDVGTHADVSTERTEKMADLERSEVSCRKRPNCHHKTKRPSVKLQYRVGVACLPTICSRHDVDRRPSHHCGTVTKCVRPQTGPDHPHGP